MHNAHDNRDSMMNCEDIQALLFDYMARELGDPRSTLIREHIRKCPACQQEAAAIQKTLALLEGDSHENSGRSSQLSENRRRRLRRAVMYPLLDWVYRRHVFVSVLVALALIGIVLMTLARIRHEPNIPAERGPTVKIDGGPLPLSADNAEGDADAPGSRDGD